MKRRNILKWLAFILVILATMEGCNKTSIKPKSIKCTDYLPSDFIFCGIDGNGAVKDDVSTSAIEKQIETDFIQRLGGNLSDMQLEAFRSGIKIVKYKNGEELGYWFKSLSNGDVITIRVIVDEDIETVFGITIKGGERSYTVSGLTDKAKVINLIVKSNCQNATSEILNAATEILEKEGWAVQLWAASTIQDAILDIRADNREYCAIYGFSQKEIELYNTEAKPNWQLTILGVSHKTPLRIYAGTEEEIPKYSKTEETIHCQIIQPCEIFEASRIAAMLAKYDAVKLAKGINLWDKNHAYSKAMYNFPHAYGKSNFQISSSGGYEPDYGIRYAFIFSFDFGNAEWKLIAVEDLTDPIANACASVTLAVTADMGANEKATVLLNALMSEEVQEYIKHLEEANANQ